GAPAGAGGGFARAGAADRDGVRDEGEGEDGPAPAVTPAACLEPKMADTMFPKTLIFSSCVVALRSRGTAGLFVRISRGALWRGFRCLSQIAVSLVTGICKHRAFRDPAPTAFRSSLGKRIVLAPWNCVSTD